LTSRELGEQLALLLCRINDDNDADWIPTKLRKERGKKKGI